MSIIRGPTYRETPIIPPITEHLKGSLEIIFEGLM